MAMTAALLVTLTGGMWLLQTGTAATTEASTTAVRTVTQDGAARWQALLQRAPDNRYALAQLGLARLAAARVSADPALYTQAQAAFDQVLAADPRQIDALVGQGMLALARHDFAGALVWAERAAAVNPRRVDVLGIRVDGLVELGRYDEAVAAAQAMVDLRPGLEAYARISYLRELHGEVDGAIAAMQAAVDAGMPGEERTLWCLVQLGRLYAGRGDLDRAATTFNAALATSPTYLKAEAELALVDAARGNIAQASARLAPVVEQLPIPTYVIALGDLYHAEGDEAAAKAQYELARALQQLNAAAGMDVDLELARFLADHGDADQRTEAVQLARRAYATRATIHTADVLAWALYRNGDAYAAWPLMEEALRLGTQDAHLHLRAADVARAADLPLIADDHALTAYTINPTLKPRQ
ncbi:MAG: hypothetical protein R2851_26430 [Caldilineaceae bacterium]